MMVERICRACQTGNHLEAARCSACGAYLEAAAPTHLAHRAAPTSLAQRLRQSPVLRSPAAKSLALGVAALAMDVGAALINKRKQTTSTAITPTTHHVERAFLRRREWEEFDAAGNLRRRVVEHVVIRDE